jgi:hypothetical protein
MYNKKSAVTLMASLGMFSFDSQATVMEDLSQAVKDSTVNINLRYRYETSEEDNLKKDAEASTLRTRLTVNTGNVSDFDAVVEIDSINTLGPDDYDDATGTGNTDYSVVADPEGLDLNQAYIRYTGFNNTVISAGRQRIIHNEHRFLGNVGWRQNEQTFDGYRAQIQVVDTVNIDYGYIHNVNTIFGSDSVKGDLKGDFNVLNVKYIPAKEHQLSFFAYLLDFDTDSDKSSDTYGVDYSFDYKLNESTKAGALLSFAIQSDTGANTTSYDANYYLVEVNGSVGTMFGSAGLEVLGSDNGFIAFSTPLATLHKFNGFADMFLVTPDDGLEDIYMKVGANVLNVKLSAVYHTFSANNGSADLGSELDLMANYKVNTQVSLLAKYATYDADTWKVDTDKFWLMANVDF